MGLGALGVLGEKLGEILVEKGTGGIFSLFEKNKKNKQEKLFEWYHNFIVYDYFRNSNHYYSKIPFSKHLLHLLDEGESKSTVIEMLEYLSNVKPTMYQGMEEDLEDLRQNRKIIIRERPITSINDFIYFYSLFEAKYNWDFRELFEAYKTNDPYVCYILENIHKNLDYFDYELPQKTYQSLIVGTDGALSKIKR